jgi:hypothetical protein
VEKRSPKILATSLISPKLANVNNHPKGENSPNLVTLQTMARVWGESRATRRFFGVKNRPMASINLAECSPIDLPICQI